MIKRILRSKKQKTNKKASQDSIKGKAVKIHKFDQKGEVKFVKLSKVKKLGIDKENCKNSNDSSDPDLKYNNNMSKSRKSEIIVNQLQQYIPVDINIVKIKFLKLKACLTCKRRSLEASPTYQRYINARMKVWKKFEIVNILKKLDKYRLGTKIMLKPHVYKLLDQMLITKIDEDENINYIQTSQQLPMPQKYKENYKVQMKDSVRFNLSKLYEEQSAILKMNDNQLLRKNIHKILSQKSEKSNIYQDRELYDKLMNKLEKDYSKLESQKVKKPIKIQNIMKSKNKKLSLISDINKTQFEKVNKKSNNNMFNSLDSKRLQNIEQNYDKTYSKFKKSNLSIQQQQQSTLKFVHTSTNNLTLQKQDDMNIKPIIKINNSSTLSVVNPFDKSQSL
eukprot:403332554